MPDKILIVDDDIDSLKLIGLMLQRHGYEVVAANAGNQALTKAAQEHPDLIILDVMMPDMDGYEVCRRLRANPDTRTIPIIMFTAKTLVDDKVAGFEAGADDYLTKPTHPAELASRVKAMLARSATQQHRQETNKGVAIGFVGVKGGVGTTTLALNVAAALTLVSENPIVADFRLGSGSLGLSIGFGHSYGMANVLSKPVNEIQSSLIDNELIIHQSGLRALLSSVRTKEALLNYSVDAALAVVHCLKTMGRPAIFDLGSSLNHTVNRLQREMDQVVLVVEPNGVALAMAREILNELDTDGTRRIRVVVVNRSSSNLQTPWHEIEQTLGQEICAVISAAHDQFFQATKSAVPLVIYQPNAVVSSQIIKLSEDLNARIKVGPTGEMLP